MFAGCIKFLAGRLWPAGRTLPRSALMNTITILLHSFTHQSDCHPCKGFLKSEFRGFRSWVASWLFLFQIWPLLTQASLFEAAWAVGKIDSGLNWNTIYKFTLPKSVKHTVSQFKTLIIILLSISIPGVVSLPNFRSPRAVEVNWRCRSWPGPCWSRPRRSTHPSP